MIQIEIIENIDEEVFVTDLNYFLEKLAARQLVDIKFQTNMKENSLNYVALIIYQTE